jgi:hypothetical protein
MTNYQQRLQRELEAEAKRLDRFICPNAPLPTTDPSGPAKDPTDGDQSGRRQTNPTTTRGRYCQIG